MKRVMIGAAALLLFIGGSALAQTSTSYKLKEHTLNAGGTPSHGTELASGSFRMTISSLGDGLATARLGSASFRMDAGFDTAYPPPGEVAAACAGAGGCLRFIDGQTLAWPAEQSAGTYNLYRDGTSSGYGVCEYQGIGATTQVDAAVPPPGEAFFFLATVENRLTEEGTKGFQSGGSERLGATGLPACP